MLLTFQSGWWFWFCDCLLSTQFIASSDARVLGARCDPQQDKVLGAGHGRVAPPAHGAAAEMDFDGDQPGCDEREWLGHTHPQHADQDDGVLPQQVSVALKSTFTRVYRDVGWTFVVDSWSKITVCCSSLFKGHFCQMFKHCFFIMFIPKHLAFVSFCRHSSNRLRYKNLKKGSLWLLPFRLPSARHMMLLAECFPIARWMLYNLLQYQQIPHEFLPGTKFSNAAFSNSSTEPHWLHTVLGGTPHPKCKIVYSERVNAGLSVRRKIFRVLY